jgi:hypothetical protein
MRPGQHNNKRGRNRNRSRHSGGGGGGGNYNGNPANRVFDSNGPDVKLRGTAQTIAEKYMQLGRDAQASGDIVMSESYYQHSEHYYRLWLANQPAGQPIQFSRRNEEEFEEEAPEADDDDTASAETPEPAGEQQAAASDQQEPSATDGEERQQDNRQRQRFDQRDQGRDGNRDNGRERFRQRWPRRGERPAGQPRDDMNAGQSAQDQGASGAEADERGGNWEAPSFLTRPVPAAPASDVEGDDQSTQRRPRREFRPRRLRSETENGGSGNEPATDPNDA